MSYLGNPGSNKIITTDAGGRLIPTTAGSGLNLSGATLSTSGGPLPSTGDYTWILSGAGPYANQGSAGTAQAVGPAIASPSSTGLWPSGRTGLRVYGGNANQASFSASQTFTAAWQSTSFTIEAYFQVDYQTNLGTGASYLLVFNDFGVGSNAIYLDTSTQGSTVGYNLLLFRAGGLVTNNSIPAGLLNNRPIHLAYVFDRTSPSAVTSKLYIDGLIIASNNHGSLGNFTTSFNQFELMLGGTNSSGIIGWANLTASAKNATQIRENTLLLKAA